MSSSVAAIIYFACGFPIAMYLVIRRRPTFARLVVWSLFWPVFAAVLLFRLIRPTPEMRENARRLRVERIAAEIEREAFNGESMAEVFEFREVFYRYAGLAEAASTTPPELTDLHERCLSRNNRVKLAFHAAEARDEFVSLTREFPARSRQYAIDLAELLGDREAKQSLAEV
jgi:hypothetical protein